MHVIFRENHSLEELETPVDLDQSPANLVFLSFSDSDLGAFAAGWHRGGGPEGQLPTLRLANLAALKHPLSVDTYIERTLSESRGILIRLIGGVAYWTYGLQRVEHLARTRNIALAVLSADGRFDAKLDQVSTLPLSTLRQLAALCERGGALAAQAALTQMAVAAGFHAKPVTGPKGVPQYGAWSPQNGVTSKVTTAAGGNRQRVLISFYRSYLVADDLSPIKALFRCLQSHGYIVEGVFSTSLKDQDASDWIRGAIRDLKPAAIVNATAFSGRGEDGTSPLDAGSVPVFQVALATSTQQVWKDSHRGLAPADLAMHVVLPEVDGRIFAGVASFKDPKPQDPYLEYSRYAHAAAHDRIDSIVNRIDGWLRLVKLPVSERRISLLLSTYPAKDWNKGHAVGLDTFQSAKAILEDLKEAGYSVPKPTESFSNELFNSVCSWDLADYEKALNLLPRKLRDDLYDAWGSPSDDDNVENGKFHFRALRLRAAIVAFQPERGERNRRKNDYHDLSRVPRHAYVAFYLWLQERTDALVHIGAHGTLEWLPGKSVALSQTCWPEVLTGSMPVIYPFIVNDPGEAAQAKRRLGAITLGHVPPAMKQSKTPNRMVRLEALLDEFSNADGLDYHRRDRLQESIRDEAQRLGIENDLNINTLESNAEAITRIDQFVCDIKDSQFGEGLHVWGRPQSSNLTPEITHAIKAERSSLITTLSGQWIAPGPSGSPYRGRLDVLPTGRNMFSVDPRAIPTRAAYAQGKILATEFIRHHLQTEGDWPKSLVIDLWGSATMRTAGEEFAMALCLLGVKPIWDEGSERIGGIEILPINALDWPRVDVTLRVSGLFRDVFPTLSANFNQAIHALAKRDEETDWNPFIKQANLARVYGPAPGTYGLGVDTQLDNYSEEDVQLAGNVWIEASSWALDGDDAIKDSSGISERVRNAIGFLHCQDLPETDLLLAADYASHEAGFAAAQSAVGGRAILYHLDNTNPSQPRTRTLSEEIARVVHARAAHPDWVGGMRKHGYRGAAEVAATLDHLAAFAKLANAVSPHLFDLFYEATFGDPEICTFLEEANPDAYSAMGRCFSRLVESGLWKTRLNSVRINNECSR
ncbi:MAG: cobaltochelatase subunit CobN [Aestuariivita sp.]|nr:cobaltochelatase subunit CobN [Aestuariivita sp.]MCY4202679.1 cobaltochelatase subunit CobN [Aestuariivita sp.]